MELRIFLCLRIVNIMELQKLLILELPAALCMLHNSAVCVSLMLHRCQKTPSTKIGHKLFTHTSIDELLVSFPEGYF